MLTRAKLGAVILTILIVVVPSCGDSASPCDTVCDCVVEKTGSNRQDCLSQCHSSVDGSTAKSGPAAVSRCEDELEVRGLSVCSSSCNAFSASQGGTRTVACQQKSDADDNEDCADFGALSRKLDCDDDQTAEALAAGCVRQDEGSSDVCCPTSVSGTP